MRHLQLSDYGTAKTYTKEDFEQAMRVGLYIGVGGITTGGLLRGLIISAASKKKATLPTTGIAFLVASIRAFYIYSQRGPLIEKTLAEIQAGQEQNRQQAPSAGISADPPPINVVEDWSMPTWYMP